MQQRLYLVLLGGKHAKANVEVHDVIPVVTHRLDDCYEYLKNQWFGLKKGLHVDGWMQVNGVNYNGKSYRIEFTDQAEINPTLKLFFINLGAYLPDQFGEIHKYVVVAGHSVAEAKAQGKLAIEKAWFKPHTDAIVDVDACILLQQIEGQYIRLVEDDYPANSFMNDYIVI